MRLSTKGRYAVTAMLDLAIHHAEGPVTLAGISENQGISLSYLEQLFARLKKHGLVEGLRGPGGGYRLARPASEIRVVEIFAAVDETVSALHTGAGASGGVSGSRAQSMTNRLWESLSAHVYVFLHQTRLSDVRGFKAAVPTLTQPRASPFEPMRSLVRVPPSRVVRTSQAGTMEGRPVALGLA